jgi:hypothetical protein
VRDAQPAGRCPPRSADPRGRRLGIRESTYDELELVAHWRRYLETPMRYLRHVIDAE